LDFTAQPVLVQLRRSTAMFAGRYLWWNATAAMGFLFFSIYFYYLTWLAIRVSGCASVVGQCGALETQLNGVIRPYGLLACGVIVLATGVLRVHFLKMSALWGLALFIWFGASAAFFFDFSNLWFANIDLATILSTMPIEAVFLVVLVAFLACPVELYKKSPQGALRVIYYVAGFTASYSFSFTVANAEKLPSYVRMLSGSDALAMTCVAAQHRLREFLSLGQEGSLPMVIVLGLFIAALSYLVIMRKAPGGTVAAPA
jgi:hypothetical protein